MQSSWPRRFVDAETAAELGLRRGAGGLFDERRLDGAEGKRGQGADGDSSSVLDSHELRRATREMEAQDSSWVSDMNETWTDPCMPPPGRPGWYPPAPAAAAAHLALRRGRRRTRGAASAAHARGAARRSYPQSEWDADRALWRAASAGDNRGAASPRSAPEPHGGRAHQRADAPAGCLPERRGARGGARARGARESLEPQVVPVAGCALRGGREPRGHTAPPHRGAPRGWSRPAPAPRPRAAARRARSSAGLARALARSRRAWPRAPPRRRRRSAAPTDYVVVVCMII